jgi:hypothetical protein
MDAFEPWGTTAGSLVTARRCASTIRDLYGVEEISASSVTTINERIAARLRPGLYRWVFKERARIRRAFVDDNYNAAPMKLDPEFFVPARKFDRFVTPQTPKPWANSSNSTGVGIPIWAASSRPWRRASRRAWQWGWRR